MFRYSNGKVELNNNDVLAIQYLYCKLINTTPTLLPPITTPSFHKTDEFSVNANKIDIYDLKILTHC